MMQILITKLLSPLQGSPIGNGAQGMGMAGMPQNNKQYMNMPGPMGMMPSGHHGMGMGMPQGNHHANMGHHGMSTMQAGHHGYVDHHGHMGHHGMHGMPAHMNGTPVMCTCVPLSNMPSVMAAMPSHGQGMPEESSNHHSMNKRDAEEQQHYHHHH